jgi:alpha-tubulin suppressor-like RCC1 family protein
MIRSVIRSSHPQSLWRWGSASKKPVIVPVDGTISAIANGTDHSVVVVNGQTSTYGSNKYMQLGRGNDTSVSSEIPATTEPVLSPVTDIACGSWHTVSVHADGSVRSFGWGGSMFSGAGALGLGSKNSVSEPTLVEPFCEDKPVQVSCGNQHTLILTESNNVYATGHGGYGILGTGDANDELVFVAITALENTLAEGEKVVKIRCGSNFSALITNKGNLYVWGRNDAGQLGLGAESQGDMHSAERYPRKIPFFESERIGIKDVACGENHVVAVAQNGAIYYWGDRNWLEPHVVSLPEANGGLKGIVKIAAGAKYSFALSDTGLVYAWGSKKSGCLVADDLTQNPITPIVIHPSHFNFEKVTDISAGRQRCSAVTSGKEFVVTSDNDLKTLQSRLTEDARVSVVDTSA